jgi:hypothetical protein
MVATASPLDAFQWTPQPQAQRIVHELVTEFIAQNSFARMFADQLRDRAGVRFIDIVDHVAAPASETMHRRLGSAGFTRDTRDTRDTRSARDAGERSMVRFIHHEGMFPTISLIDSDARRMRLAIKVERVGDFLASWNIQPAEHPNGAPTAPMRRALICDEPRAALYAIERHGSRALEAPVWPAEKAAAALHHREMFRTRKRDFGEDEAAGFVEGSRLIDASIRDLGVDYTCDLFFAAERDYWMRRNRAGRVQKARQDALGIGWANHDHHTYRCSRANFARLVAVWEKLGFHCRERFYAGREAGWGAQVMEQPNAGIITFNDVDLTPDELMGDFSHEGLRPQDHLGTVGLWCGLHGDSFNQAGMHHLEAQFDFESLRAQLEREDGVRTMKPFTDFSYLRQAFTEGERWIVAPARIDRLLGAGLITAEQAGQFRAQGAIGSHLENLERNDGFKGFNQTGVSEIIAATDPRKQLHT